ncbi:OadG-related small transporter subunit [Peptoniphilus obesi]|nr:OadG-related small transporter subunit [Peptoniphilus obesi]
MSEVMLNGLEVSLLGFAGVFIVLILFYLSVKIMMAVFKDK